MGIIFIYTRLSRRVRLGIRAFCLSHFHLRERDALASHNFQRCSAGRARIKSINSRSKLVNPRVGNLGWGDFPIFPPLPIDFARLTRLSFAGNGNTEPPRRGGGGGRRGGQINIRNSAICANCRLLPANEAKGYPRVYPPISAKWNSRGILCPRWLARMIPPEPFPRRVRSWTCAREYFCSFSLILSERARVD
jgi:hypothetical protein